jgi:hypothetical protein
MDNLQYNYFSLEYTNPNSSSWWQDILPTPSFNLPSSSADWYYASLTGSWGLLASILANLSIYNPPTFYCASSLGNMFISGTALASYFYRYMHDSSTYYNLVLSLPYIY